MIIVKIFDVVNKNTCNVILDMLYIQAGSNVFLF